MSLTAWERAFLVKLYGAGSIYTGNILTRGQKALEERGLIRKVGDQVKLTDEGRAAISEVSDV